MKEYTQWEGFEGRIWKEEVNVRDFIQKNYTPYAGDESFLAGPTEATNKLWGALQKLQKEERAKGALPRPPISCGAPCRSCKRKSAPRAACWTWRPKWSAA